MVAISSFRDAQTAAIQELIAATRFPPAVASRCSSYLFSTDFSSIPHFVDFFRNFGELQVPANQPLCIRDISILTHDLEAPIPCADEDAHDPRNFLDVLLAPLAKRVSFSFPEIESFSGGSYRCELFAFKTNADNRIRAEETSDAEALDIRLRDLYRVMMRCGIPEVNFRPGQRINICGLTKSEFAKVMQKRGPNQKMGAILDMREPPASSWALSATGVTFASDSALNLFQISASSMKLSLEDRFHFSSIAQLLERFAFVDEIALPPNQSLIIEDDLIEILLRDMEKVSLAHQVQMLLDHVFLPSGRVALFSAKDGEIFYTRISERQVGISAERGFVLQVKKAERFGVHLPMLNLLVLAQRRSSFQIGAGKRLLMADLTEEEARSVQKSEGDAQLALAKILHRRSPIGFTWKLPRIDQHLECVCRQLVDADKQQLFYTLELSCPSGFEFRLERPTADEFVLNLIRFSPPEFLDELFIDLIKERVFAIRLLVFRALSYFCYNEFLNFERCVPPYFRDSTQKKLGKILEDRSYLRAVDKIVSSDKLRPAFEEILCCSSKQLETLRVSLLPEPIAHVVATILDLVEEEFHGNRVVRPLKLDWRTSPFLEAGFIQALAKVTREPKGAMDLFSSTDRKD